MVDLVETDAWPIALVVIVFMALCFCGCVYFIKKRFEYKAAVAAASNTANTRAVETSISRIKSTDSEALYMLKQRGSTQETQRTQGTSVGSARSAGNV